VTCDEEGKPESVRYEAINVMLLNEFLKEHRKVEKLEVALAQQRNNVQADIAQLTARLKEDEARIQKVSAQLEVAKPTPQLANNHR
jgi:uncharacterized protein YydD (DUF2326 family)